MTLGGHTGHSPKKKTAGVPEGAERLIDCSKSRAFLTGCRHVGKSGLTGQLQSEFDYSGDSLSIAAGRRFVHKAVKSTGSMQLARAGRTRRCPARLGSTPFFMECFSSDDPDIEDRLE
jgi:hypothetical protein